MERSLAANNYRRDGPAWKKHRYTSLRECLVAKPVVVFGTCGYANSMPVMAERKFQFVAIDESAQASEAELVIPISRLESSSTRPGRLCLIGDHQQLPAISNNPLETQRWSRSLMERLHSVAGMDPVMLETQYRIHEAIAA